MVIPTGQDVVFGAQREGDGEPIGPNLDIVLNGGLPETIVPSGAAEVQELRVGCRIGDETAAQPERQLVLAHGRRPVLVVGIAGSCVKARSIVVTMVQIAIDLENAFPAVPVYVDADPTRLAQIVGNLLNNASKFTGRGGHIRLTVECANDATPDDAAYIMYTSGSTGKPKGATINHHGVVNNLNYLIETYHVGASDTVLQLAALSFEPCIREIFVPLSVGGRLVLVEETEARIVRFPRSSE